MKNGNHPGLLSLSGFKIAWIAMLAVPTSGFSQHTGWPHAITPEERNYVERMGFAPIVPRGVETPPPFDHLRTAAEWEEIEALTISWTG